MIYPEFPKEGDVIGVCAPSAGVGGKLDSFEASIEVLNDAGFEVWETDSVRSEDTPSAIAAIRGDEFNTLFADPDVAMAFCAAGGDYAIEMLPYIDQDLLRENPKWFAGYSDPTSIEMLMTTKLDIATIYGVNAGAWDWRPLHEFQENALAVICGEFPVQHSFDMYSGSGFNEETGCYEMDTPVEWTLLRGNGGLPPEDWGFEPDDSEDTEDGFSDYDEQDDPEFNESEGSGLDEAEEFGLGDSEESGNDGFEESGFDESEYPEDAEDGSPEFDESEYPEDVEDSSTEFDESEYEYWDYVPPELHEEYELDVTGRLIGGCIDVIYEIIGTDYEDLTGFAERYKDDGLIWFFDNFALNPMDLMYATTKMKLMGLFDNAHAVIFGRTLFHGDATDVDYLEQLERVFGDMDVPVIWNADIGHTKPSLTIINGAIGHLQYSDGYAELTMELA